MSYKPFYIANFEENGGLFQFFQPFLIPEKAFPKLEDAFAYRGTIRRRIGFTFLGRLRRCFTTPITLSTQASAASYTNVDILNDASINLRATEPNAEIEPGSLDITVGAVSFADNGAGVLVGTPGTNSGTVNYITGAITLSFSPALGPATNVDVTFCYFPSFPVMGLRTREIPLLNDEQTVAFDTKYAYRFLGTAWEELPALTPTTWQGTNSDFFWTTNFWQTVNGDLFWATNFNKSASPDPIRYYDSLDWVTFAPQIDASPTYLEQCRALLPYKDRLLAFNTWEGSTLAGAVNFPQRLRWSQNSLKGDPTDQVNGWRSDIVGRGGFIDAPTNEAIVSAEFIKDTIVVKFERSSWKIIYTGNQTLPFVFQKINTELGAESTFSLIPFDRGVFSVGNYGITTDDSVNVTRIDEKIPDIVFNINNDQEGVKRVYGIRDYSKQLVYWTFPNSAENPTFPNKVLVYNYINQTYAIFNDSFTCYGYFQKAGDFTWATIPFANWASWLEPWDSGDDQSKFPDIVAGNQQGYTMILNQSMFNGQSLSISAITPANPVRLTVVNHNLQTDQFVKVINIAGSGSPNPTTLNNVIYRIIKFDDNNIDLTVYNPVTGIFDNVNFAAGGTYLGAGELVVLNNMNISTKLFSPFFEQGSQVRFGYVDFFLDKTSEGEVSVDVFIDENDSIPINDPDDPQNEGTVGDNIVLTRPETGIIFQPNQKKIWHRMYVYAICQNFQLQIFFDNAQMSDEAINSSDFVMHALTLYLTPNARMIQ